MKNLILVLCCILFSISCSQDTSEDQARNEPDSVQKEAANSIVEISIDRFEEEISEMEKKTAPQNFNKKAVLFTGSSSIRMWDSLSPHFDPIPVLNHGFGGSTLLEVIHYADRIIFPFQPELIVLYCGENDISEGAGPEQVFESYKKLDELISEKLPETELIYISMKPSLARWNLWNAYKKGNELIKNYLENKEKRHYIDCSPVMLDDAGLPEGSIFIHDGLHMNLTGYERWANLIRPKVEQLYQR